MVDFVARPRAALETEGGQNRQHARVVVAWKARLIASGGLQVDAKAIDLSEGGLGIVSPNTINGEPEIEVWLAVPANDSHSSFQALRVRGRIVFQVYKGGECRIGLQFTAVDDATRNVLRGWVRKLTI